MDAAIASGESSDEEDEPPRKKLVSVPEDEYGEWRVVPGVEGLKVSSQGWVQRNNLRRGGWSRPEMVTQSASGYRRFVHCGVLTSVHESVCRAFHGSCPSSKHTPDHIGKANGDWFLERGDNRACNLRWADGSEQALNRRPETACRDGKPVRLQKGSESVIFPSTLAAAKWLGIPRNPSSVSDGAKKGWLVHGYKITWAPPPEQQDDLEGEEWREANDRLRVSSMGRAQARERQGTGWAYKLTLKPRDEKYARAIGRPFHVLVALAFLGPRPTPSHTVDHIDRDISNNKLSNLRWATRRQQLLNRTTKPAGPGLKDCEKRPIESLAPGGTDWIRHDSRMDAVRHVWNTASLKLSPGSMYTCAKRGYRYKGYRFRLC